VVGRRWGDRGVLLLWIAAVGLLALWVRFRVLPSFAGVPDTGHTLPGPTLFIVPWVLGFAAVSMLARRRLRRGFTTYSVSVAAQCAALFLAGGLVFFLIFAALDFLPLFFA
jgi:hypothetical protein